MSVLYLHGADLNFVSRRWSTALHQAVRMKKMEKVEWLVERGADPRVGGRESAVEYVQREEKVQEEYVRVLEEAVADLEREEGMELGDREGDGEERRMRKGRRE
jgi:fermentation-respiration switch protein FrsA (DUF1100 family)